MSWDIAGFDSTYLRPIFAAKIIYAAGPSQGQGTMNVLCVGLKISAGDLTVDSEVRQVFSQDDCITAGGDGSQVALMGISAFLANPNANVFLAAVTEGGGLTASTVTMSLATVPTKDGTLKVRINGKTIQTSYAAGTAVDTIGANITAAVNGQPNCPFTAAYATPVMTLTSKNKGVNSKDWIIYQDLTLGGGLTSTMTGSATVNTYGAATTGIKGVRSGVAGGAGTEDYTTVLTKLTTKRYARIALGSNDTTNAALVKTFLAQQAAFSVALYDQALYGQNNSQSLATTLAQTTLNDPREQVLAHRNSETHPALIAAGWAAMRAATENDLLSAGVPDYDNFDCSAWVAPTQFDSDTWLATEENALLNAGVTPIKTLNATSMCVRAITTYCLNGAAADTRCLDIGDGVVPDFLALDTAVVYSEFRQANKLVEGDPDINAGDTFPESGVAYPLLWTSTIKARYFDWRKAGLIEDTFSGDSPAYPINSTFNKSARRIQSNLPFVVARIQHQLSAILRQAAPPL